MGVWKIEISAEKAEQLKNYAKQRGISLNKLFDEMATITLVHFDARNRFEQRAKQGDPRRGRELLEKIERILGET
jgi:hypothetical protein